VQLFHNISATTPSAGTAYAVVSNIGYTSIGAATPDIKKHRAIVVP
jgi:hypothetical protein